MLHSTLILFKSVSIFSLLLLIAGQSFAQKNAPAWVDYQQRTASYPIEVYLTGFYSESNIANTENDINRMKAAAQKQLIESVKVSIKSVGEVEIENINTKTSERFKQTSTSVAEADLVGLQYETWFDKKAKTGYAFAYAKKIDVQQYYQASLEKTLQELRTKIAYAQQMLQSSVLQSAIDANYASQTLIEKALKAQAIILALSGNVPASTTQSIQQSANTVDRMLEEILNHPRLTLDNVATYFAHELAWQWENQADKPILLKELFYESYSLESPFSKAFMKTMGQKLVSIKGVALTEQPREKTLNLSGNYRIESEKLLVSLKLLHAGSTQSVAAVEGRIPLLTLANQQIQLLPDVVAKWQQIDALQLQAINETVKAKLRRPLSTPLQAKLSVKPGAASNVPVADIPLRFVLGSNDNVLCRETTGSNGLASCKFGKVTTPGKMQIVRVEIDMPAFTGLPATDPIMVELQQKYTLPSARFVLQVRPLSIYLTAEENNMGRPLSIKLIEPELKQQLADQGFDFVTDAMRADYSIELRAHARHGNKLRSIHFSYVDATISLMDMNTGKEIYKDSFADIKGGGSNYEQAGIKAFSAATEKIRDGVLAAFDKAE